MPATSNADSNARLARASRWRHRVLLGSVAATLVATAGLDPIAQDPAYHDFADRRAFAGVPNALDVLSNLAFLVVGVLGLRASQRVADPSVRRCWLTLFAGVTLVSAGSGWYHLAPDDRTLVWDRLPMTLGFAGLVGALAGEYLGARWSRRLLAPALGLGVASVAAWIVTGDLRAYIWFQLASILAIPLMAALYRSAHSHGWLLPGAFGLYALAKVAEALDGAIFDASAGLVSGHTLKHLLAAAGCYCLVIMLARRQPRVPGAMPVEDSG